MTTTDVTATVRSFVDLRRFAETAACEPGDWLGARVPLTLPEGPVFIAALALAWAGRVPALPTDEFVIVLEGAVTIDGVALVTAGRSMVLSAGLGFRWEAEPGSRVIVMGCSGETGAGDIVPINEAAPLEASGTPLAELLVGATPNCRNHTDYRSPSGEFVCGVWDSTPYHRLPMRYRHYELMHLLEGAVSFEDGAGRSATFRRGDVFLVEQGADCSWLSEDYVRKVYAIYRPA